MFETAAERRSAGRPVGEAFYPLADNPEIQAEVFAALAAAPPDAAGHRTNDASAFAPSNPMSRPERSVRLMHVSCGGMATGKMNRMGKVEGAAERDQARLEARYNAQRQSQNQSRAIAAGDHFDELARLRQQQQAPASPQQMQREWGEPDAPEDALHPDECYDRLFQFYSGVDPSKVDNIEKLMSKYAGKEQLLLTTIEQKYELEPGSI